MLWLLPSPHLNPFERFCSDVSTSRGVFFHLSLVCIFLISYLDDTGDLTTRHLKCTDCTEEEEEKKPQEKQCWKVMSGFLAKVNVN